MDDDAVPERRPVMKFEDYPADMQAELMALGDSAADAIETQDAPMDGDPENDPNFSPELELSRLLNRRRAELEAIDAQITRMVLLMHRNGQSWEAIGRKLNITGEATRLRYAKLERK